MGTSGGFLQKKQKCPPVLGRQVKVLLRDGDGTHRAGLCGFHGGGYGVGRQLAWHSDGQDACHLEYLGADPGALGAADAEIGVNECFHGKFLSF